MQYIIAYKVLYNRYYKIDLIVIKAILYLIINNQLLNKMATTTMYDVQKKELMEYYDKMSDVIESHKRTYTKLVEKLNKPTCGGSIMNKTLDNFMGSVLPPFKEFSDNVIKRPFTQTVKFMYDLNKKLILMLLIYQIGILSKNLI